MEALGAVLGRLGQKLGDLRRSWPQIGTLLAACWDEDGEDEPRWANINAKRVAKGDDWGYLRKIKMLVAFGRESGGA